MTAVTSDLLKGYDGANILEICGRCFDRFDSASMKWIDNHCAHFIGHALSIRIGATCWPISKQKGERAATRATIRCNELFNSCDGKTIVEFEKGERNEPDTPKFPDDPCLIYITLKRNFDTKKMHMGSHKSKHVGILIDDVVWQYSNGSKGPDGKVKPISVDAFMNLYDATRVTTIVLTTDFPDGIVPVPFAGSASKCVREDVRSSTEKASSPRNTLMAQVFRS